MQCIVNSATCNYKSAMYNFMLPKRRFWKTERTFVNVFSNGFSNERSPNKVLTPLKTYFEETFPNVRYVIQIFVWEA